MLRTFPLLLLQIILEMSKNQRIVIVGAGVFGLSMALKLAKEGYSSVVVLDRSLPPVPDGSSNDISRIIRFDYGDETYARLAKEAYDLWSTLPEYKNSFNSAPFMLVSGNSSEDNYSRKSQDVLKRLGYASHDLKDAATAKRSFPSLTGGLAAPDFGGYYNTAAGWADAGVAITRLRDDCARAGVSFITGRRGTIKRFQLTPNKVITAVETLDGDFIEGDMFVLAAGAWSASLVSFEDTTIATGQIVGYIRLTPEEVIKMQDMPIYSNITTGFFCFPPHKDSQFFKVACHGYGYTRASPPQNKQLQGIHVSSPPSEAVAARTNYIPESGRERLLAGVNEILPELVERGFERTCVCWYTDTPTGDFVMDFHPGYKNLFLATGGSGQ